ncbi:MAG: glycosyltransferase [Acidobacteria bacterium]|nr:glycosyltransferase [Acidobacteriota bacterium]
MIFLFYICAAVLVYFSWKSFRGGLDYLAYFRAELARPRSDFTPFATVFAPCRGLDDGLEENLAALFRQDFPRYEIVFVVDSERDEAVETIEKVRRRFSGVVASRLVVAGPATNESQKVHNLRAAVGHAADESEIFVFVDSDARPAENWLRALAAPLRDERIGAATGYRWFIAKSFGPGAELRSVWNASIASALGPNRKRNFCWGGSTALRRATFDGIGMRAQWRGTLSDDFAVTRALGAAGLEIYFVPAALAVSVEDCTLRECLEFTTRQMKITRVYAPHLWKMSFVGSGIFNLVWLWGILNLFFYPAGSFVFWFSAVVLLLNAVLSIGKAELRRAAVRLALKDHGSALRRQFFTQNTLWILSPALFFYNAVGALVSRRIVWRGLRYELKSPSETIIYKEDATAEKLSSSDSLN